jgi:hypothetical protein
MESTLVAIALLALAVALAGIGLAGLAERLPRNRLVGLRTAGLREDDESWRIGHRAAGGPLIVAAGPPLLLGAALIAAPPDALEDWLLFLAVVGVITGGLIALASRQAQTALAAHDTGHHQHPPQEPE